MGSGWSIVHSYVTPDSEHVITTNTNKGIPDVGDDLSAADHPFQTGGQDLTYSRIRKARLAVSMGDDVEVLLIHTYDKTKFLMFHELERLLNNNQNSLGPSLKQGFMHDIHTNIHNSGGANDSAHFRGKIRSFDGSDYFYYSSNSDYIFYIAYVPTLEGGQANPLDNRRSGDFGVRAGSFDHHHGSELLHNSCSQQPVFSYSNTGYDASYLTLGNWSGTTGCANGRNLDLTIAIRKKPVD